MKGTLVILLLVVYACIFKGTLEHKSFLREVTIKDGAVYWERTFYDLAFFVWMEITTLQHCRGSRRYLWQIERRGNQRRIY